MTQTISAAKAVKVYFEQQDKVAPRGGREVKMAELKELGSAGWRELGSLCAAELGMELVSATK